MTFGELLKMLNAYALVMPGVNEQDLYGVSIDTDGMIRFSLEETTITIPIT